MKKILFIVAWATIAGMTAGAQEYKIAKNSGRLEILEVNHVTIEGHSGNEIIFTAVNGDRERDERAKGLRALSSMGLQDNTGLGLSVLEKGNAIEVQQLKKTDGPEIKILVPKGVVVSYTHTSPFGRDIQISNFAGEIQISTVHSGVRLTNTSGTTSVKTVHGDIDASLSGSLSAAITLESDHGHVDVALPVDTKANLTLNTDWGEVLVDPDFKIELQKKDGLVNYRKKISATLNGGGTALTLTSNHDNVYLRKK